MPVRLIVCEATADWTVALRWSLATLPVRVETKSEWSAAYTLLAPDSMAIGALEAALLGLEGSVRAIAEVRNRRPRAAAVALISQSELAWEPWLWEAGAMLVVNSRRNLSPLARLVSRYLEQNQSTAASLREAVWQRMPWGDAALI